MNGPQIEAFTAMMDKMDELEARAEKAEARVARLEKALAAIKSRVARAVEMPEQGDPVRDILAAIDAATAPTEAAP